jgi:ribosome-binding protein aMBF1 (putative translation factor)
MLEIKHIAQPTSPRLIGLGKIEVRSSPLRWCESHEAQPCQSQKKSLERISALRLNETSAETSNK